MRLDVGCGANKRQGFIGLDINPACNPDIVGECGNIPLPDNAVMELSCINVLEHCEWSSVKAVLKEFARVVSNGGTVEIHVPDIGFVTTFLTDGSPDWNDPNVIGHQPFNAGKDRWEYLNHFVLSTSSPFNMHRGLFWFESLQELLENAGFSNVERLPSEHRWLYVKAFMRKNI